MKNSMVEQILLLIEENRTLRRELEDWRMEAERATKELDRVFEYGEGWVEDFKKKYFHGRAPASTWDFGQVVSKAMGNFSYGEVPRFECEGPPETEEAPRPSRPPGSGKRVYWSVDGEILSDSEHAEYLKKMTQEGYEASKREKLLEDLKKTIDEWWEDRKEDS